MVRVGNRADNDAPCLFPGEEIVVNEDTHKLGYAERGVRIVDVDSDLVGKVIKCSVHRHVVADNTLNRGGDKEILL